MAKLTMEEECLALAVTLLLTGESCFRWDLWSVEAVCAFDELYKRLPESAANTSYKRFRIRNKVFSNMKKGRA